MMMRAFFTAAFVVVASGILALMVIDRHAPRTELTGQAFVIDGDTIIVAGMPIRIAAIDAPESDQTCNDAQGNSYACGTIATAYLKFLIADKTVRCIKKDTDRYGRTVARCSVEGRDLGDAMVRAGHAVDYIRYDRAGRYAEAQAEAQHLQLGMWRGTFVPPEVWRHRK